MKQFAAACTGAEWELVYKMSSTSLAYKHTLVYTCRNVCTRAVAIVFSDLRKSNIYVFVLPESASSPFNNKVRPAMYPSPTVRVPFQNGIFTA